MNICAVQRYWWSEDNGGKTVQNGEHAPSRSNFIESRVIELLIQSRRKSSLIKLHRSLPFGIKSRRGKGTHLGTKVSHYLVNNAVNHTEEFETRSSSCAEGQYFQSRDAPRVLPTQRERHQAMYASFWCLRTSTTANAIEKIACKIQWDNIVTTPNVCVIIQLVKMGMRIWPIPRLIWPPFRCIMQSRNTSDNAWWREYDKKIWEKKPWFIGDNTWSPYQKQDLITTKAWHLRPGIPNRWEIKLVLQN